MLPGEILLSLFPGEEKGKRGPHGRGGEFVCVCVCVPMCACLKGHLRA